MKNQTPSLSAHSLICRALYTAIFSLFFLFFISCRTQKQVQYLQGPLDTAALSRINFPEPKIQKGDLIGITVYSDNPEATAIYNQVMTTTLAESVFNNSTPAATSMSRNTQTMPGYLVDERGNIFFHQIGLVYVEGLTKTELKDILKSKLSTYLKNPYCNIRFLNYKITILGEVTRQGVYSITSERVNIFEALGMAGDFTVYGLKDSIMVIREVDGHRTFGNLDVSNPKLLLSPFYYLQQNDIVIVKANSQKPTLADQTTTRNLAIIATIATIITSASVLLNIFLK